MRYKLLYALAILYLHAVDACVSQLCRSNAREPGCAVLTTHVYGSDVEAETRQRFMIGYCTRGPRPGARVRIPFVRFIPFSALCKTHLVKDDLLPTSSLLHCIMYLPVLLIIHTLIRLSALHAYIMNVRNRKDRVSVTRVIFQVVIGPEKSYPRYNHVMFGGNTWLLAL